MNNREKSRFKLLQKYISPYTGRLSHNSKLKDKLKELNLFYEDEDDNFYVDDEEKEIRRKEFEIYIASHYDEIIELLASIEIESKFNSIINECYFKSIYSIY